MLKYGSHATKGTEGGRTVAALPLSNPMKQRMPVMSLRTLSDVQELSIGLSGNIRGVNAERSYYRKNVRKAKLEFGMECAAEGSGRI